MKTESIMVKILAIFLLSILTISSFSACDKPSTPPQVVERDFGAQDSESSDTYTSPEPTNSTLSDCPQTQASLLEHGDCGFDVEYSLYADGLLCIYGSGDMYYIANSDEVAWYPYKNVITDVYIADGITSISCFAFKEFTELKTAILPDTLETIYLSAFEGCTSLEQITLPESIRRIDYYAFYNCDGLKEITFPGNLSRIDNYVINHCSNLESVTICEGVKQIGWGVFSNCEKLVSITMPKSIKSIDVNTFRNCNNLSDIYYSGTSSQWNNVRIQTEGNELLEKVTVHYGSGN